MECRIAKSLAHGDIVFSVTSENGELKEVLRLASTGAIFVKGRHTINDPEVVDGLRDWLARSQNPSVEEL